jgi:hypothetical protein
MRRFICAVAFVLAVHIVATAGPATPALTSATTDPYAYFNTLVGSSASWKAYSLRDQSQLDMYKAANSLPPDVTYDPANDTNPLRQDAAKVVIPEYVVAPSLASAIDATQTTITLTGNVNIRQSLKIDDEILLVGAGGSTVPVTRGYAGTKPAPHAASATVWRGTNSLPNQVWLPMGTEDGHRYLTTWDAWFDERCLTKYTNLVNWKTFQFRKTTAKSPSIWFEVRTRFDGGTSPWKLALNPDSDVAAVDVRSYSAIGPNVTDQEPLSPMLDTFRVVKQTWTRYWMEIDQRANDWDLVSLWVADANHDAVQIFDRLQVEVDAGIHSFQLEFNTSTDALKPGRGPLTVYVRNVVMLRDVSDTKSLLQRPGGGVPLPPITVATPSAPSTLRIVKGL